MGRFGGVGTVVVLMGLVISSSSSAQQSVMNAAGYSGLSVTPTADLLPWGSLALSYANEVVSGPTVGRTYSKYGTSGHNIVIGFGVLPFLEISGRMATNKIQTNCYTDNCGIRDLSFNFKGGFALDSAGEFKIAAGANDFGGNANFFRTVYGVATYSPKSFDFSLGYAHKSAELVGGATPIDGIFGSIAYRPMQLLQTQIEYNKGKTWTGVRMFAPAEWLPSGWSASLGANFRLNGEDSGSRSWFNFGLSIPLYKVPEVRRSDVSKAVDSLPKVPQSEIELPIRQLAASGAIATEFSTDGLPASSSSVVDSRANIEASIGASNKSPSPGFSASVPSDELDRLADALSDKGFEDIYVGRMPNGAIAIQVNNATYNVNTADGLGVALGIVARRLSAYRVAYHLVITQRQIAVVGVVGQSDCLAQWIATEPNSCIAGILHTPGTGEVERLVRGADWQIERRSQSWKTARFIVQPVLRTNIATEYGALDYSAGIRSTIQQPLWKGAYLEWSHISPISQTSDFEPNSVYGADRIVRSTDKILLHQVIRVPVEYLFGQGNEKMATRWGATALTAHAAIGRINSDYRGVYGELRWEPSSGLHRFGVEGGRFDLISTGSYVLPKAARPMLASYRYSFLSTRTDFELTAGQYLYSDRGAQVTVTQWFDDVALNLYIRRTKYEYERDSRTFAGIELVIPLTPRKDMNPGNYAQFTGASRWAYGLATKVGGTNFINTSQGILPGVAVLDQTFNADRSGVEYFEQNMARIRSAASK